MKVNILEAKNRLSELIRAAQAGEEVIIANRGRPAVKLVPTDAAERPPKGSAAAILQWLDSMPPPRNPMSPAEIDALVEENRNAWD
jgi:prevent-host-death family protein